MPAQTAQNILDMDFRISLSATSPSGIQLPYLGKVSNETNKRENIFKCTKHISQRIAMQNHSMKWIKNILFSKTKSQNKLTLHSHCAPSRV